LGSLEGTSTVGGVVPKTVVPMVTFNQFWTAVHDEIFVFLKALDGVLLWKPAQLDELFEKLVQEIFKGNSESIWQKDDLKNLLVDRTSQNPQKKKIKDVYIIGKIGPAAAGAPDTTAAAGSPATTAAAGTPGTTAAAGSPATTAAAGTPGTIAAACVHDLACLPSNIVCAWKVAEGGFYNYAGNLTCLTVESALSSCIVVAVSPPTTSSPRLQPDMIFCSDGCGSTGAGVYAPSPHPQGPQDLSQHTAV
jgi:hypothetical protein